MIDFTDVLLLCLYNHDCLFPDTLMYYYYVYITMIVYFLTDVMKWLRGKWNQLMKLVIPV